MRPVPRHVPEAYFERRFGVPRRVLAPYLFYAQGKARSVWMGSRDLSGPGDPEFQGMRCLRLEGHDSKPTSAALIHLAPHLSRSVVDASQEQALDFLAGDRFTPDTDASSGYVAVRFRGDVLGCGLLRDGEVRSKLPKRMRVDPDRLLLPE